MLLKHDDEQPKVLRSNLAPKLWIGFFCSDYERCCDFRGTASASDEANYRLAVLLSPFRTTACHRLLYMAGVVS